MSHKHLLLRLMFFRQNLEYLLHNCLFLNVEWSIALEIDRTKENARYMGSEVFSEKTQHTLKMEDGNENALFL